VLSRILWLSGLEVDINRLGNVDTMRRYIYIHGGPDHGVATAPESHGCIRMKSDDVIDLFDRVDVGVRVDIV
jgi:lipoprotein-anchoring transpeptidase ErfK/SrfK